MRDVSFITMESPVSNAPPASASPSDSTASGSAVRASSASHWQRHAQRTVRRLNLAWWLQFFAPVAAGLGLLSLLVILLLRSRGMPLPAGPVAGVLTSLYLIAAAGCWLAARRKFTPAGQGMVWLESHLKLNNALSAADQGVTAWPQVPGEVDDGFRFRAPWLVAPALLTVACLTLAFLLPVSQAEAPPALPPPMALSRAEAILNALKKEDVADPAALEKARDQLEALLSQPPEEFYSHHNLEAADTLETSLQEAAGALGNQLRTAAQAAESLEKYDTSLSPSARQQLESDLNTALEGLKNSSMGTSEALEKQLSQLDPSKLKELDPAQLKKMLENLKAKSAACKNCQGGGGAPGAGEAEQALQDLLDGKKPGKGQGEGEGKDGDGQGEGMGRGGVNRGPGTGPLTFEKNATDFATNKLEQIESNDLSRSLPGDHLGTKDIEHQLDKTATGPADGGAAGPSGGGDAVWRDQLLPSEQKVLQRYFK